jgi:glycosyltransferase involved in cell wall biosynthesis
MNDPVTSGARVAIVANTSWYVYNLRLPLMLALRKAGHEVMAIAPRDAYCEGIAAAGFPHRDFPLDQIGINPLRELASIRALRHIFRAGRIDTVFSFTPKGNIYSAFALGGPPGRLVATISGLGRAYSGYRWLRPGMMILFRRALARADRVLFQNTDDLNMFKASGIVAAGKAEHIAGSGVNLTHFAPTAAPDHGDGPVFLLVARMLRAKGVELFVEAAEELKKTHPHARFQLLGPLEPPGPDAVPERSLHDWTRKGTVEYLGTTDDVRPSIRAADCIVLPTLYREGVPRSLLEAAAMSRPLITTDMPGCRDTVDDGVNGFLCRPGNLADLVAKMDAFARLDAAQRNALGAQSRAKMERQFDETTVIRRYLELVRGDP